MSQSRPEYTSSTFARDFVGRQTVIERLTSLCLSIVKEGRGASASPASRVQAKARCGASCFAA